ncbi:MAG TPA: hypothetical protein VIJ78_08745 [Pseudolabrys sp.]
MGRAAEKIANFFGVAFWPLAASVLVVLLLQPVYFLSLASLGSVTSRARTIAHLNAGFEQGVLSDTGNPSSLIFKGGEQLTECISLGIGLDPAETSLQTAITGAYPVLGNTHECEGLHHAVSGAQVNWQPYFRYWHGYRVILAPLVSAFPIWLIKIINAMMVAAACVLLWRTLRDCCDKTVATILLLSFVCLSDVLFIWRTSTHSLSLAYILAGASLFAAAMQRNWGSPGLIVLVAVMGSGFNFIDFLINPPMMPMLIAFFVLLSGRPNAGPLALAAVVAWFGGYSETWLAKWIIDYVSLPDSAGVVSNVLSTIQIRTVGALNSVYLFPFASTARVFLRSMNRGGVIVPLIVLIAVAHYAAFVSRIDWRRALWLWSPVLVCFVWFEALSSHSQQHLTVTSRSAAMALAIMLSALVISMPRRPTTTELYDQLGIVWAKFALVIRKR